MRRVRLWVFRSLFNVLYRLHGLLYGFSLRDSTGPVLERAITYCAFRAMELEDEDFAWVPRSPLGLVNAYVERREDDEVPQPRVWERDEC